MTPVELLDDHRAKPRNIGKLLNANAVGDIGSIVVGDALRFYIQVKDERITAAKFQVFNAQDQLATGSATTELAVGKTLDECLALGPADLCAHLGGLTGERLPASLWALEGLKSAVCVYRGEEPECDTEGEPLVCRCHGIPEETIRTAVKVMNLKEVDDIVNATGAGSACGSCRVDIPRIIAEALDLAKAPTAAPVRKAGQGRIPTMHKIMALVDTQIRPGLPAGAEVELQDLDGNQVVLTVTGLDGDAQRDLLGRMEQLLKSQIEPSLAVRPA